MTPEDAERWIVNLIRNARLDAKIDSKLVGIAELPINTLFLIFLSLVLNYLTYWPVHGIMILIYM